MKKIIELIIPLGVGIIAGTFANLHGWAQALTITTGVAMVVYGTLRKISVQGEQHLSFLLSLEKRLNELEGTISREKT